MCELMKVLLSHPETETIMKHIEAIEDRENSSHLIKPEPKPHNQPHFNNIQHFDWENRWLKGDEYAHILANIDQYCQRYNLDKYEYKSHPECIYKRPGKGVGSDFGFPRVNGKKRYRWKKMNFTTNLPKKTPYVTYVVASAMKANVGVGVGVGADGDANGEIIEHLPDFRMHAVIPYTNNINNSNNNITEHEDHQHQENHNNNSTKHNDNENNIHNINSESLKSLEQNEQHIKKMINSNNNKINKYNNKNNLSNLITKINKHQQQHQQQQQNNEENNVDYILCHVREVEMNIHINNNNNSLNNNNLNSNNHHQQHQQQQHHQQQHYKKENYYSSSSSLFITTTLLSECFIKEKADFYKLFSFLHNTVWVGVEFGMGLGGLEGLGERQREKEGEKQKHEQKRVCTSNFNFTEQEQPKSNEQFITKNHEIDTINGTGTTYNTSTIMSEEKPQQPHHQQQQQQEISFLSNIEQN